MLNLYIMRHGETILNRFNRIQGWADSPLTYEGELQSIAGGTTVAHIPFDAIYTSDTQRAMKTAERAMSVNKQVKGVLQPTMSEIREFNFGQFEGLEAKPVWQAVYQTIGNADNNLKELLDTFCALDESQTAEDYNRFGERIDKGLERIVSSHKPKNGEMTNVLIVTHALTINYMMQSLCPENTEFLIGKNGSIRKVVSEQGQFSLVMD